MSSTRWLVLSLFIDNFFRFCVCVFGKLNSTCRTTCQSQVEWNVKRNTSAKRDQSSGSSCNWSQQWTGNQTQTTSTTTTTKKFVCNNQILSPVLTFCFLQTAIGYRRENSCICQRVLSFIFILSCWSLHPHSQTHTLTFSLSLAIFQLSTHFSLFRSTASPPTAATSSTQPTAASGHTPQTSNSSPTTTEKSQPTTSQQQQQQPSSSTVTPSQPKGTLLFTKNFSLIHFSWWVDCVKQ